jgi:hypothetical protein
MDEINTYIRDWSEILVTVAALPQRKVLKVSTELEAAWTQQSVCTLSHLSSPCARPGVHKFPKNIRATNF